MIDDDRELVRPLDDVRPPDLWVEVTDRLDRGDVPGPFSSPARSSHRSRLLAVAVVLVVVAIGGVLALAQRGDRRERVAATTGEGETGTPTIWGRTWELERITLNRGQVTMPGANGSRPVLDLRVEGAALFTACNTIGGAASLADGVLRYGGEVTNTAVACRGGDGEQLMQIDHIVTTALREGAEVTLDGDHLTLTQFATTAEFVARTAGAAPAEDPTTTSLPSDPGGTARAQPAIDGTATSFPTGPIEPGTTIPVVSVPVSPEASCSLGFRTGLGSEYRWEAGPVNDRVWVPGGPSSSNPAVVHATLGVRVIEVQAPGTVVDAIDQYDALEEVEVPRVGTAKLLVGDDYVQVNYVDPREACDGFSVTVASASEVDNRSTALEVARYVLRGPR